MTEEVIYNYRSVNRAIDLEVDKYRAENWSRYSRIFLHVSLGIGGLAVLLALAWYIYVSAVPPQREPLEVVQGNLAQTAESLQITETAVSTPEESREIRADLQKLEARDALVLETPGRHCDPTRSTPPLPKCQRIAARSWSPGGYLNQVTGKPSHQYCYLEIPGLVGGSPIVDKDSSGNPYSIPPTIPLSGLRGVLPFRVAADWCGCDTGWHFLTHKLITHQLILSRFGETRLCRRSDALWHFSFWRLSDC